jgi:hypothetical protein
LHVFPSVPFIDRFDCNPFIFLIIDRTEKPSFLGYNFKWKNCVIFRPYAHQKICKMFHAHMKQHKYHMFFQLVKQKLGKHDKSHPHPGICRLYWRESITMANPTHQYNLQLHCTRMRVGFVIVIDSRQYNLQLQGWGWDIPPSSLFNVLVGCIDGNL